MGDSGLWSSKDRLRTGVQLSRRLALWTFVAFLIAAFFLVLFRLGSYRWFHRDDFEFIAAREATSLDDLFRPANNSHWTTVPLLAFRALWAVFGLRSYLPYQAAVLTLHLSACVLLRVIMRRAGVGPWIATAAASAFVLFGPGWGNIIWAFQITYTGSLVFGLVQIVLGDHDGPVDWRDGLGIAAGFLALMSSGAGVTMVAIAALAMLLRRGWRVALLHSAPLAAAFLVWSFVEHPQLSSALWPSDHRRGVPVGAKRRNWNVHGARAFRDRRSAARSRPRHRSPVGVVRIEHVVPPAACRVARRVARRQRAVLGEYFLQVFFLLQAMPERPLFSDPF